MRVNDKRNIAPKIWTFGELPIGAAFEMLEDKRLNLCIKTDFQGRMIYYHDKQWAGGSAVDDYRKVALINATLSLDTGESR